MNIQTTITANDVLDKIDDRTMKDVPISNGILRGIDYEEHGEGPTIVLVPGSCSTGAAWRPVVSELGSTFRCITTSLLGYGGTSERRTVETADMAHEAEIVEEVVRRATGPIHLVGHSFGGTAALAVALRNRMPLVSLTVLEPIVPELLRHLGESPPAHAPSHSGDRAPWRAGTGAAPGCSGCPRSGRAGRARA